MSDLPDNCEQGTLAVVIDAATKDDCSAGGGNVSNVCVCNSGGTWDDEDAAGAGSGYLTIEDEDTPLAQRSVLNFAGDGVACADDTDQTTCTISGGGGGSGDNITVNGATVEDADFDDASPAAPADGVNIRWQLDTGATPDSVSANLQFAGATTSGALSSSAQSIGGAKTFVGGVIGEGGPGALRLNVENPNTPSDNAFEDSPDFRITGVFDSDPTAGVTRAEAFWVMRTDVTSVTPDSTLLFIEGGNQNLTVSSAGDVNARVGITVAGAAPANQALFGDGTRGSFRAIGDADVPDTITLDALTQITSRPISDTTGDLAASRVDDGGAAATQTLFSGGAGAAGFRAIADADVPDTITLTNLTQITTRNHSDLQGIGSDDHHAQSHVLAGTSGLGADHTTSGLTAGQVLRATGASTAAFGAIQSSDLPALAGDVDGAPDSNDLDELAVEAELEAVLDIPDLQGVATKVQLPSTVVYEDEANIFTLAGGVTLDNQLGIRLRELDANGDNFFEMRSSASRAADYTVTWAVTGDCSGNLNSGALTINASNEIVCSDDDGGEGGSGDITAVGDCTSGDCFVDGTDNGSQWIYEGTTVDTNQTTLTFTGDPAGAFTVTIPNETGTIVTSGTSAGGDLTGTYPNPTVAADSVALTTDTTGDYVQSVADGTGIDGTATGEGSTYTPTLDLTEINSVTFGDNSIATVVHTVDPTGTTNPAWSYSDGVANLSTGTLQAGGAAVLTSEANDLEADDPPNVLDNEVYVGTGAGAGAWTVLPLNQALSFDGTAFGQADFSELAGQVGDAQIADGAVDGGSGGEIADGTIAPVDTTNALRDMKINFTLETPATADDGKIQAEAPTSCTLQEVACNVGAATSVTINLYERARATPESGTTGMLTSDLVCDTDGAVSSSFSDSALAGDVPLALGVIAVSGTPEWLRVHVKCRRD